MGALRSTMEVRMSAFKVLATVSLAAFAVACGRSEQPKDRAMDQALMSDLESAAAPTAALASSQFKPRQVVSAIELGEAPAARAPERTAAPARRAKPSVAAPAPEMKTVDPDATDPVPQPVLVATASAADPAPAAPEPATTEAAPITPTAGPRPTPNPVHIPEPMPGRGGMGGRGTVGTIGTIGRIGGVIIRGGSIGDDDHCEIHPGGGGVMINVPSPVIRPTFPRGAW
jgi:hypothetical protein